MSSVRKFAYLKAHGRKHLLRIWVPEHVRQVLRKAKHLGEKSDRLVHVLDTSDPQEARRQAQFHKLRFDALIAEAEKPAGKRPSIPMTVQRPDMLQTENYQTLLADLRRTIGSPRFALIGIEGRMLAGKTPLAKRLAEDLGLHVPIHVDDFRPKPIPDGPYVETLDLRELAQHLDERQEDFPTTPVIIDGICLREVLDRIGRRLDLAIYVKKLSKEGLWHTQFDLEDYENDPRPNVPKVLYDDEMRYHLAYRPHEIADFYFEWTE